MGSVLAGGSAVVRRPLHVLVVDDNPEDLLLAEIAFGEQREPYQLTTAVSGEAALRALDRLDVRGPDLILLDIHMPGMDGFEVLRQIKGNRAWRGIPVVMLSTSDEHVDIRRAYENQASAYLVKQDHPTRMAEQFARLLSFWAGARLTHWPDL